MRASTLSAALIILGLTAATSQAQTFTIKPKDFPAAGKSITISDTSTVNFSFKLSTGGMDLKEEKKTEVEEKQFVQKTIEAGTKRPNKYSNTYTKATKGEQGSPAKTSYSGKTIIFERKGDKYTVKPEEGEIDAKDLAEFTKQVNRPNTSEVFMPTKAVAVGDSWTLDKKAVEALGGPDDDGIDLSKFKGQGKLLKAYKKGKEQWGTVEIAITVPIKKLGPLPLDKAIDLNAKFTIDMAIDGSTTAHSAKGTMSIKGKSEFTENGMTFMIDLAIEGDIRMEQSAEK